MVVARVAQVSVSALAALFAGPAAAAGAPRSPPLAQCIDTTDQTSNWIPIDDHTILVRTLGHAYRVTTSTCQNLASPMPRITKVIESGSRICSPLDARLYVSNGGDIIPTPCLMQSIDPITLDEAKALEKKAR
jgi:hypothetical protein